ncbi:hypothetical protein ASPWEDRAFT_35911 [Aspergillus wentii DTO 134E9]|uniref:Protein-S-isoprenylcysteine O-methyltransferase n=1 Tax=Aspergillus wentii DTO 134E9 TaxID=1073089 RepID=A0A1L9RTK2_ASPWE|nr:uncharacterized protein ASPWEDRAFT_35911 [Aspergillus wentii DTO 134E9]OJJ38286.1 hypothetical protein ASPWEDRAFT_35911 [Aspergillus wentii DTO 134E9]
MPLARKIGSLLFLSQAMLSFLRSWDGQSLPPQVCPNPSNVNSNILSWTPTTILAVAIALVGASIRLPAYRTLGRNFTFDIAPPDRLVTSGAYRYLQHPSYTGQFLVISGCFGLFFRWDGPLACWFSPSTRQALDGWGLPLILLVLAGTIWQTLCRIQDEEMMMKEKFGKEWEEWHSKTSRLIPGLF